MHFDRIKLNLIHNSADRSGSSIVLFQKNVVPSAHESVIAWLVIENLRHNWSHPFDYECGLSVRVGDEWGNVLMPQPTSDSARWSVGSDGSGDDHLQYDGDSTSTPSEVQIKNDLPFSIRAEIYRSGRRLAVSPGIAHGQHAGFRFDPVLYVGLVSQVKEGHVLDPAIVSSVSTTLSLTGLTSADILFTGGGPGRESPLPTFTLCNQVFTS